MKIKKFKSALLTTLILLIIVMSTGFVQAENVHKYYDEAFKLYTLGLYKGTVAEYFQPSLGEKLNREEALSILIQFLRDEKEIAIMSNQQVNNALNNVSDGSQIATWNRKYAAYAYLNNLIATDESGKFSPKESITGTEYCAWILKALGYEIDLNDKYAAAKLVDIGGLSTTQMLKVHNIELIRDDLVGITFSSLNAFYKDGETVIAKLVRSGKVSEERALSTGVYVREKLTETLMEIVERIEKLTNSELNTYENIEEVEKFIKEAKAISLRVGENEFEVRIILAENRLKQTKEIYSIKQELEYKLDSSVKVLEQLAQNKLVIEYNIKAVEDAIKNAKNGLNAAKEYGEYEDFEKRINEVENEVNDIKILALAEKLVSDFQNTPISSIIQIEEALEIKLEAEEIVNQINNIEKREQYISKITKKSKLIEEAMDSSIPGKVISADATSLKQLNIVFSKPILGETIDASTFNVSEEINFRRLSDDGRSLTLLLSERLPQNSIIYVTIDGIKDVNGNVIDAYEAAVMAMDVTSPKVEQLEFVHNKLIKLKFSEPFDFINSGVFEISRPETLKGADFKIDGKYFYGRFNTNEAEQILSIELLSPLQDGEHVLELSGIKDWAGFKCLPYTKKFISHTDDTPPEVVKMLAEDTETINITFNEPVSLLTSNVRVTEFGGRIKSISKVNINGENVVIKLAEPLSVASLNRFTVRIQHLQDIVGNVRDIDIDGRISDDNEAPKIESHLVTNHNTLKIIFDKAVDVKDVLLLLYDLEGNAIAKENAGISIRALNESNNEYEVFIQYIRGKRPAQYSLQLSGIVDKSVRKNAFAAKRITFTSNDEYKPIITKASKMQDSGGMNDIIEIVFSEAMDTSTLNSLSRYILKGIGRSQPMSLDGIEGAKIVSISEDGKRVILIASRTGLYGYDHVTILGAVDAYGKALYGTGSNMGDFYKMD